MIFRRFCGIFISIKHTLQNMETKLHHFAYDITQDNLELVVELLEKLGCKLSYREENSEWCLVQQKQIPIYIQIIETKHSPLPTDLKIDTHIAFLSNTPKKDIEEIKQWVENKGIRFRQGAWSDKELWFDLPDIFVNFVIEIMRKSIAEDSS